MHKAVLTPCRPSPTPPPARSPRKDKSAKALTAAVGAALAAGVIPVVAASNDRRDAKRYSPGNAPGAVTVGATALGDGFAFFSNYGKLVDILAPVRRG